MAQSNPITFALDGPPEYRLVGTFTRYSSWTARAVTVLEYFKIPYTATYVKLPDVKSVSKSGFVPLLIVASRLAPQSSDPQNKNITTSTTEFDSEFEINDSLSICEFLAESHPDLPLWPRDPLLRALARSAAAEMHSGFSNIRNTYHSNFLAKYEGDGVPLSEEAKKEVERILRVWGTAREATGRRLRELGEGERDEGYLFGGFGIVDAFYWPILWRFRSYGLPLTTASSDALAWMEKMWSDPTLMALGKDYFRQAENPETLIEKYEDIFSDRPDVKYGTFEEDWKFKAK